MTRRRWIADEISGETAALTGEHAAHLARVLRAQVGQQFDLAVNGIVRQGKITSIADERVEFALGAEIEAEASAHLTLVLAIFKFDRMEWAIEKCTEIGVARIVPLIARRTDAHLAAAAAKRHERWERLARQASEQARRVAPPEITHPLKWKDLIDAGASPTPGIDAGATKIVLAESGADVRLRDILTTGSLNSTGGAALAIGPEGGWTEEELRWFGESGWTSASLGNTILRAETAAIVATALAVEILS
ncbi:MAG: RsmE family RNA methyltransferase [Terriglobales bacterium]|jgi:16S rRNA (uracil1498-N3)-methyltransferase